MHATEQKKPTKQSEPCEPNSKGADWWQHAAEMQEHVKPPQRDGQIESPGIGRPTKNSDAVSFIELAPLKAACQLQTLSGVEKALAQSGEAGLSVSQKKRESCMRGHGHTHGSRISSTSGRETLPPRYAALFSRSIRECRHCHGDEMPYDAADDFANSINVACEAVRERVASGGPTWTPKRVAGARPQ
jgi:hypothetical protein